MTPISKRAIPRKRRSVADLRIAKLITFGRDRAEATARIHRALEMFVVEGIYTSIPLHQRILSDPDFLAGKFDTNFVKRFMPAEAKPQAPCCPSLLRLTNPLSYV